MKIDHFDEQMKKKIYYLNYLLKMVNVAYTPYNTRIRKSTESHLSMEIKFSLLALPSCTSLLPLLLTFNKNLHGKDH